MSLPMNFTPEIQAEFLRQLKVQAEDLVQDPNSHLNDWIVLLKLPQSTDKTWVLDRHHIAMVMLLGAILTEVK